jgi:2-dehydro-3-deoxyphosphooctonate aldolase (KDO 8-P synthase)
MLQTHEFHVGEVLVGGNRPFVLIAGPCVIESEEHCQFMAKEIKAVAGRCQVPLIFKASFDKANRTSLDSFRGPGLHEGLRILKSIREELAVPILTDIHEINQIEAVALVIDCIQVPAFLCRQTDLLVTAAKSGRAINVKKGQFLAPWDVEQVVKKLERNGCQRILLTERGTSFGYNNLVVDVRSFPVMRGFGYPVLFDVTHSLQLPGGLGTASGGQSQYIDVLARAGVAAGIDGLFMEVHDSPANALSDGPNSLLLERLEELLKDLKRIDGIVKETARNSD